MMAGIFSILAAALIFAVLVSAAREMMLFPIKWSKRNRQHVIVELDGREPRLRKNLEALLELNRNGVFKCCIIIVGSGLDDSTRQIALAMEKEYSCISFFEDGDIPTWIRNLNFWS